MTELLLQRHVRTNQLCMSGAWSQMIDSQPSPSKVKGTRGGYGRCMQRGANGTHLHTHRYMQIHTGAGTSSARSAVYVAGGLSGRCGACLGVEGERVGDAVADGLHAVHVVPTRYPCGVAWHCRMHILRAYMHVHVHVHVCTCCTRAQSSLARKKLPSPERKVWATVQEGHVNWVGGYGATMSMSPASNTTDRLCRPFALLHSAPAPFPRFACDWRSAGWKYG